MEEKKKSGKMTIRELGGNGGNEKTNKIVGSRLFAKNCDHCRLMVACATQNS